MERNQDMFTIELITIVAVVISVVAVVVALKNGWYR